jgi:hypothetical protein
MSTSRPSTARAAGIAVALGLVLTLGLSGCSILSNFIGGTPISRDDSGAATEDNENADAFTITVGDCLNDSSIVTTEMTEVATVPLVTCDKPHDTEVISSVLVEDGEYPGDEGISTRATDECLAAFEDYIGFSYADSVYDYGYYLPTEESWAGGDREILCTVYDPAGPINGTLEGAGV